MIVKKHTETSWTLSDRNGSYFAEYIEVIRGHQFILSKIESFNEGFFVFEKEVYTTQFWAADAKDLSSMILGSWLRTRDHANPIELVYEYGGSLSREISTFYSGSKQ